MIQGLSGLWKPVVRKAGSAPGRMFLHSVCCIFFIGMQESFRFVFVTFYFCSFASSVSA